MADERRCIVVLAPDVLAKSFVHYECREVLERWRDGAIVLVVTRSLLRHYLQLLRKMGLPDAQLRQWAAWFTAREKSLFLPQPGDGAMRLADMLADAAQRGEADYIVTAAAPAHDAPTPPWISAEALLRL